MSYDSYTTMTSYLEAAGSPDSHTLQRIKHFLLLGAIPRWKHDADGPADLPVDLLS